MDIRQAVPDEMLGVAWFYNTSANAAEVEFPAGVTQAVHCRWHYLRSDTVAR